MLTEVSEGLGTSSFCVIAVGEVPYITRKPARSVSAAPSSSAIGACQVSIALPSTTTGESTRLKAGSEAVDLPSDTLTMTLAYVYEPFTQGVPFRAPVVVSKAI